MTKETMNEARAVISSETPDWPGALIVASGELDVQSVPELRERLAEAIDGGATRVVVDLTCEPTRERESSEEDSAEHGR